MRVLTRTTIFVLVMAFAMSVATVAVAAPKLGANVGWADGPHKSNPGLCTNCHTFQVWPAPAITEGDPVGHSDRGANCAGCHTVVPAPVAAIGAPTAFASTISGSAVTLAWTPVAGAVGGYRVYRATSAAGTYTQIAATSALAYTDSGRSAGVRYYYQVKGIDGGGLRGPASPTVSAATYGASVRVDSSLSQLTATSWSTRSGSKFYGGSTRSTSTVGRKMTVPFRGRSVTWYGTRGKSFGKAKVYVDGVYQKTVDGYYRKALYNRALFTKTGLADKPHTLTIVVIKSKNKKATGRRVDVDSFGFSGIAPGLNQEESRATAAGTWTNMTGTAFSGGVSKASAETTASMTYRFRGTGVTWVGTKSAAAGRASVYLDGVLRGTADLWAGATGPSRPVYSIAGLAKTNHTLVIVPLGAHNAVSTGNSIDVDAFVTR